MYSSYTYDRFMMVYTLTYASAYQAPAQEIVQQFPPSFYASHLLYYTGRLTKKMNCSNERLKFLKKLPSKLKSLNCSTNQIEKLPDLPYSLKSLNCSNNKIKYITALPDDLDTLDCSKNKLKYVPFMNNPLIIKLLDCSQNKILYLHPRLYKIKDRIIVDNKEKLFERGSVNIISRWYRARRMIRKAKQKCVIADIFHSDICAIITNLL